MIYVYLGGFLIWTELPMAPLLHYFDSVVGSFGWVCLLQLLRYTTKGGSQDGVVSLVVTIAYFLEFGYEFTF